ncbi:MAG TPA: CDP-diacylglycerol--glycerol-3-phosphate 3-phosphatidyltransferase [Candidatus Nanopelagicales bacterium]|nr:CDP-diacylglycerol--glycerol-3-phosphate 3-phosphatidyltransferase [Candidatus Nanopelagicales bacterium]
MIKPPPPDHVGDPVQAPSRLNLPNALTVLRLLLVPLFAWLLLRDGGDDPASRIWSAVVFLALSFTDLIDGELARRRGQVTSFGKIADPIADKALTGTALVGLSYLGELPWWVTLVILAREIGVTILRFWVIRQGVIPASRGGKAKTAFQMAAIVGYLLPVSGWLVGVRVALMAIALVLTVVTGVDYVVRAVRLRRSATAAA